MFSRKYRYGTFTSTFLVFFWSYNSMDIFTYCVGHHNQRGSDGRLFGEGGVSGRCAQPGCCSHQEWDAPQPEGGWLALQQDPSLRHLQQRICKAGAFNQTHPHSQGYEEVNIVLLFIVLFLSVTVWIRYRMDLFEKATLDPDLDRADVKLRK